MKDLKNRLNDGEAVHGCWLNSGSPINAEILGKAGFDWVTIDLEHGAGTENNLLGQLQALSASETFPIVRVEALVRQRVSRVLDLGAGGILFPQIRNADEAKQAVSFLRYPPDGIRGMATMIRATDFGQNARAYHGEARENIICIIQIETLESLGQLDEIAGIDGVDALFVGPQDLSMAMGIFKQYDHPEYLSVLKKVNEAAGKAGKATGILLFEPDTYCKYYDLGFRMLACGSDSVFVMKGATDMAGELNNQRENSQSK